LICIGDRSKDFPPTILSDAEINELKSLIEEDILHFTYFPSFLYLGAGQRIGPRRNVRNDCLVLLNMSTKEYRMIKRDISREIDIQFRVLDSSARRRSWCTAMYVRSVHVTTKENRGDI